MTGDFFRALACFACSTIPARHETIRCLSETQNHRTYMKHFSKSHFPKQFTNVDGVCHILLFCLCLTFTRRRREGEMNYYYDYVDYKRLYGYSSSCSHCPCHANTSGGSRGSPPLILQINKTVRHEVPKIVFRLIFQSANITPITSPSGSQPPRAYLRFCCSITQSNRGKEEQ